jgi:cation-transporting ATPase 13A3/4/5
MFACNKQTADIPNFVATNKTEQAAAACGAALNIQGALPDWNSANPTGIMWGECPAPDYGTLNFHEPVFLALWVYYGSLVGFLIIWLMYKTAREKVKAENRNRRSFFFTNAIYRSSRPNITRHTP